MAINRVVVTLGGGYAWGWHVTRSGWGVANLFLASKQVDSDAEDPQNIRFEASIERVWTFLSTL